MTNVLVLATHNQGKVKELQKLLNPLGIVIKSNEDYDIKEPLEVGSSFEENAAQKALHTMEKTSLPSLADDSGLEIEVLDNAPGIYSARWAAGEKSFQKACQKILTLMGHAHNRNARFVCVLAYARPKQPVMIFKGECLGSIAPHSVGNNGFGYDPIFIPKGSNTTWAQWDIEEKNKISHRAKAIKQFIQWLQDNP